ncbi:MAG: pyridoxamine 5-phosphate oxidase, partial [Pseudonocardiales bacterium]|nr:pyridoxamine 5-phosphate oxidase [Pseudonocardiales bacterium]
DVGTLAVDLVTRKRLRINGRWRPLDRGGQIDVHQAFGNCPKYIQARVAPVAEPAHTPPVAQWGRELDQRDSLLVSTADTFFIATAADAGADVSHRGGKPGFVTVVSATEIRWPDYTGNAMQMTAGNLRANPRAGLLFPDWGGGSTLQLTGTAEVRRSDAGAGGGPDTGWETVFRIDDTVRTDHAMPGGWSEPEYSRFN